MSEHNRIGRFYVKVGTRFMAARAGVGATDDKVAIRALTSDVVIGGLDTPVLSASHVAQIKDHTKLTSLTVHMDQVLAFGGWRAERTITVQDWIASGPNGGTDAARLALLTDLGFVGESVITIPLELLEDELAVAA